MKSFAQIFKDSLSNRDKMHITSDSIEYLDR